MKIFVVSFFFIFSLQIYAQQTLKVGALPFDTPFTTETDAQGHFYGFEISIVNEICKRIQVNCIYKRKTFAELFQGIASGDIDLAIGGIIITEQREGNFLFSLPYLMSYGSFIVLKSRNFNDVNDIYNKKIGVLRGSIYLILLQNKYGSKVTIIQYKVIPDMLDALVHGKIDAIMLNQHPAMYWASTDDNLIVLGKPIETGGGYAIMASKKNAALIRQINRAILSMESDGTYLKLYNDFF